MREAELLLSGRGAEIPGLEAEFKERIGAQKSENFVSAGTIQHSGKKATITFLKKDTDGSGKKQKVKIEAD